MTSTFSLEGWLPIVHRAAGGAGTVALTFDDGPSPETTPAVLDLLAAHGAKASFFLCGGRAEAHGDLVYEIARRGHGLHPHGFSHRRLDMMDEQDAIGEMVATEALLARVRPAPSPYLVRLPYGSGHRSPRVHAWLRRWRADCQIAHWSHDLQDFRLAEGCATVEQLGARCDRAVERALAAPTNGAVMLLHEHPFDAHGALVPRIAEVLLGRLLVRLRSGSIAVRRLEPSLRQRFVTRHVRICPID